ncbi:alpha/beta hydrolase family protein [Galbitalea soli]|uniref:Alpha/beta hydrolase n=1 Tax=Galbitalea soli TaxID=1268042 RepID=A0A7C9PLG7_9MICO|nr:alpha/beta fold hydrolase [Galbitalea soli]NEM90253.1 alpha/beta hydrolase [Galbitalea soli]NYJ30961.1 hypothetical protein [Galbitalea soli]
MARSTISTARLLVASALTLGAVALVGTVAAAAFSVAVARRVVTPSKRRVEDIRIIGVTETTITLASTPDSRLPGTYSFWFARGSGHAKLGPIIDQTPATVTRELIGVDFGDLAGSERGYLAGWVYLSPAELGVPFEEVAIPTELGDAPAWSVPAASDSGRWLIAVHGRGVKRAEGLRAVEVARRCGYHSLLISYRNDGDAPRSLDGRYGLGDTEWRDVDAAIGYAVEHGATEVVLMGWSMGGATVLQAATRSERRSVIRGLILESPVVDWGATLAYQASFLRIPRPVGRVAEELITQSWSAPLTGQAEPIDLARLDFVTRASELEIPVLLLHSIDDGFVPADASRALAAARPDIVSYEEWTVARHTKLWNYDSERWNAAIGSWLSRL